jgi:hypothetical protein
MCSGPACPVEIRCRIHAMSSQEQPEDQPPADDESADGEQPAGGEAAGDDERPEERAPETPGGGDESDDADEHRPPTQDERLEQVTERIEKARAQAEEAGVLEDNEEEEYVESGATEEEDDQTITPPG